MVDEEYKIASSIAITAALFAAVLMSLAQMVLANDNPSAAWEALRFFVYTAISSNLVAAGCCLWTIYALSDLPYKAQRLAMRDKQSWAYKAANGELFDDNIGDPKTLLKSFGADDYWWQSFGAICWYMLGLLLTFLALITWMWLSQSTAVAAAVTVVTIPGVVGLVYPVLDDVYKVCFG